MNEMIQKFINTFKRPENKETEVTPEQLANAYAKSIPKEELAKALNTLMGGNI